MRLGANVQNNRHRTTLYYTISYDTVKLKCLIVTYNTSPRVEKKTLITQMPYRAMFPLCLLLFHPHDAEKILHRIVVHFPKSDTNSASGSHSMAHAVHQD